MHTRFPLTGEYHEVRTHQLYFNADGWPVMSVLPYAYEFLEPVSEEAVIGDNLCVNHGKDISSKMKPAVAITLNPDRTISGEVSGSWRLVVVLFADLIIVGVV